MKYSGYVNCLPCLGAAGCRLPLATVMEGVFVRGGAARGRRSTALTISQALLHPQCLDEPRRRPYHRLRPGARPRNQLPKRVPPGHMVALLPRFSRHPPPQATSRLTVPTASRSPFHTPTSTCCTSRRSRRAALSSARSRQAGLAPLRRYRLDSRTCSLRWCDTSLRHYGHRGTYSPCSQAYRTAAGFARSRLARCGRSARDRSPAARSPRAL